MASPQQFSEYKATPPQLHLLPHVAENQGQPAPVAIPVAGAFNFKVGPLSTGGAHYFPMRKLLQHAGFEVEATIVPHKLGILGDLEEHQRTVAAHIDRASGKHHPEAHRVLITHSLGGLIAARYFMEQAQRAQDEGLEVPNLSLITLGTPHGDLHNSPAIINAMTHFVPMYRNRSNEIADFAEKTLSMLPNGAVRRNITMAGSTFDEMVNRIDVSVPPLADVRKAVFTQGIRRGVRHHNAEMIVAPGMDHGGLIIHPSALRFVLNRSIDYAQTSSDMDQYDNVIAAPFGGQPAVVS